MFKDNLRVKMTQLGMSAKDVANLMEQAGYSFEAKEPYRIVQSWVAKKAYSPNVISAYAIAKALKTTVEELVDGEDGAEYVRQWVRNEGKIHEPPERIADIVASILDLTERELNIVRGTIRGICNDVAQDDKVETNPPGMDGEQKAV
jgi:transcriptional regulator with XRE-family HTH domain